LKDAKIPIGAILGTEMGGLIGGLYAMSSTMNQFEWGLLKFKEEVFQNKSRFFLLRQVGASQGEKLETRLKQVFESKDISDAHIPLRIAIQPQQTHSALILDHGNTARALRAALAAPILFTPSLWQNGTSAMSAAEARPFLVNEARNLGIGPVVVINVLSDSESAIALDELKYADLVVKPKVSDFSPTDFQKMTDIAFRGKSATNDVMPEIRRIVGLQEMDFEKRSSHP
jgi:predicted acylesterase/phospholipase RssA